MMIGSTDSTRDGQEDELKRYLNSGIVTGVPLRAFWREHQHEYPALASLARDILSIPATGAGVERLFKSARDICHYRRGSLNTTTIQELMMFMCTSRFEVEDDQLALNKEYLITDEIQEANNLREEEEDAQNEQSLEPISDNEEDDLVSQDQPITQRLSERAARKRRQSTASEPEDGALNTAYSDDGADIPLPNSQQRLSGRNRKRARRDDDQFIEY
ncbi:hypothetical protein PHISCL_09298 [Aspergillus sclerotialis]|uniref:HAT C-terminal dimerisation domain-containing protein n=1 Tax=Aspergillus sclerotialis TaxID=2070753 RepID=A0A3A2ZAQ1_9EURO|nr:hypothetical protein PHISCL_09298 [Aspergillus sclerotialis]